MPNTDNQGYTKHATPNASATLMASATSHAESKFLSLATPLMRGAMKPFLILPVLLVLLLSMLQASSALAQDKTEAPPATDSEGMDPNQKAGAEKKKNETKGDESKTYGGGPKHGALHEDWLKWLEDIGKKPKGPTPTPPTAKPAPKNPKECARVTKEWHNIVGNETGNDPESRAAQSGWIEGVQNYCTPAE